jgi:YegS/Rv2252/BmrU family lipid kinase
MTSEIPIRACLITNPRGGKGELDLSNVIPILAAHGWDVTVQQKRHGGHASKLAKRAAEDGFDIVVACGGDGTISEIVDGVAGRNIAVGVLPGGTANLWAHEIGVSLDLERAARQLVTAERRRADLGHVTINGKKGQHFLLMAGLGLDAAVVDRLSKPLKKRVGMLSYLPAVLKVIPKRPKYDVRAELDGVDWRGRVAQIVVGNTRRYASVTSVTADAIVDDGRLDIALMSPPHAASFARQIVTLVTRNRPASTTTHYDRVGTARVQSSAVIPLEIDGGRVKQEKVKTGDNGVIYEFSVLAQAITMLVPREYSGTLFQNQASVIPPSRHASTSSKEEKHLYQLLSVEVDSFHAIRFRDHKTYTVVWTPETVVQDPNGVNLPLDEFRAGLLKGGVLHIIGDRSGSRSTLSAATIRLVE